jgi:hypothetical protein
MKTYINRLLLLILILTISSCEDVVDVTVQNDTSRLVIEASIDWEKGTIGNEQYIRLSNSSEFFDTTSNTTVTGASIMITNDVSGATFVFEDQNNGNYTTTDFIPVIDHSYTLEVIVNGETYTANETLNAVPEIKELYQATEDGFDDELLELHVVFDDPPKEGNYYFFKFLLEGELLPELEIGDDEFVNGNELDWWYELEDDEDTEEIEALGPGDVVDFDMYSISEAYGNYMNILIEQIGGVDLFDTTPVSVKGNCINRTNPENYAHGYFRLTEFNRVSYTFE